MAPGDGTGLLDGSEGGNPPCCSALPTYTSHNGVRVGTTPAVQRVEGMLQ